MNEVELSLLNESKVQFENFKNESYTEAKNIIDKVLDFDTKNIFTKKDQKGVFEYFKTIHQQLCFFPNQQLINKLKEFGLAETVLQWFIPIEKIESDFDELENSNVFAHRFLALVFIKAHLEAKFYYWLQLEMKLTTIHDTSWTITTRSIDKLFDRMAYAKGIPRKVSAYELPIMFEHEKLENLLGSKKTSKDLILDISKGITEPHYVKWIVEDFLKPKEKMSKAAFYRTIYFFLKTICPDQPFSTEEEYDRKKDISTSWKKSQEKTIRNLLKDK
jgi:hypothetical protein